MSDVLISLLVIWLPRTTFTYYYVFNSKYNFVKLKLNRARHVGYSFPIQIAYNSAILNSLINGRFVFILLLVLSLFVNSEFMNLILTLT